MHSFASLQEYLRARAGWVWNEQNHAFDRGLLLQEETLTEMLLLRMSKDYARHGLIVRLFNKAEEARNGADWEWHILNVKCSLSLRIQAKRLYHHSKAGDYGGLKPASAQTDNLIKMARRNSCIPIFVFFNHGHGVNSSMFATGGQYPYRGRSLWGCTVARADKVKAAATNSVAGLRRIQVPWHQLVSPSGSCAASEVLGFSTDGDPAEPLRRMRELRERVGDLEFMEGYTERRELAGVALMDFSEFRGA